MIQRLHAPAASRRRWWRPWQLILLVSVVSALVVLPVLMLVGVSGGWEAFVNIYFVAPPDPENPKFVERRNVAVEGINNELDRLATATGSLSYGTSSYDHCYAGQNNWKVQEGYAYRCAYRITRFYGFDGEFEAQMTGFETRLIASGWVGSFDALPALRSLERSRGAMDRSSRPPTASDLEDSSFEYEKGEFRLTVACTDRKATDFDQFDDLQSAGDSLDDFYSRKRLQDVPKLLARIATEHDSVLAVSVERIYFEN